MYAHERESLIQQYLPMCWKVARKVFSWPCCHGLCEVEDLYQTGVIGLIQAVDHWDNSRPFAPYAWRSIHNTVLNYLRRCGLLHVSRSDRRTCKIEIGTQANMTNVFAAREDDLDNRKLAASAVQEIAGLNPKKRRILELYFGLNGYQPRTLDEIGQILGISRQGVHFQKQDALNRLRKIFADGNASAVAAAEAFHEERLSPARSATNAPCVAMPRL